MDNKLQLIGELLIAERALLVIGLRMYGLNVPSALLPRSVGVVAVFKGAPEICWLSKSTIHYLLWI